VTDDAKHEETETGLQGTGPECILEASSHLSLVTEGLMLGEGLLADPNVFPV
jgi:hypothetical protein